MTIIKNLLIWFSNIKLKLIILNYVIDKKFNYNIYNSLVKTFKKIIFVWLILVVFKRSLFISAVVWYFVLFLYLLLRYQKIAYIELLHPHFQISSILFVIISGWLLFFILQMLINKSPIKNPFLSIIVNIFTIYLSAIFGLNFFIERNFFLKNSIFNIII